MICPDFKPNLGGIAEYASQFAVNLNNFGNEVTIFCPKFVKGFGKSVGLSLVNGLFVKTNNRLLRQILRPLNYIYCIRQFKKLVKKNKFDLIIITSDYKQGCWVNKFNIPYVIVFHGGDISVIESQNKIKKTNLEKKLYKAVKKSCGVICNSHYTKKLLIDKLNSKTVIPCIFVSGCGVSNPQELDLDDLNKTKKENNLENNKVILTVGRLIHRKGLDDVINAVNLLRERYPNLKYLIVSDGPDRQRLESMVENLKLKEMVFFFGKISEEKMVSLYKSCDIFAMPNKVGPDGDVEGFGIVYLEANSYGKPVIGGNSGGVPDAVIDGLNGFLIEPGNVENLTNIIALLLDDKDLRHKIGKQGFDRVKKEYTWEKLTEKLIPFLKSCCEK